MISITFSSLLMAKPYLLKYAIGTVAVCATPASFTSFRCRGQWLHEVKFDSWRIQLHKHGGSTAAFTKNGHDHSNRVRWMIDALAYLKGVRSLVIDGEVVACDAAGLPSFYRLHFHRHDHGLCVWAFDLLHHNVGNLRELPLIERKARLEKLIIAANAGWLLYSESFDDG
jgi:bifunctional non-homologous end joining protein LigD